MRWLAEGTLLGLTIDNATWIGLGLGAVGFVVGIAGLVVALVQLRRTQDAITASDRATARTERSLALKRLLVIAPLLDRVERELDIAVGADDRDETIRHLTEGRTMAHPIQGLVAHTEQADDELRDRLRASVVQAAQAKARLLDQRTSLLKGTKQAREEISIATQLVGELSGRLQALAREEEDNHD